VPSRRTLCDSAGRPWILDGHLAAGGEGTVHPLVDDDALLAKIYNRPPSLQTVEKLTWMVRTGSPTLRQIAAWPTELLFDKPDGREVGFLMPRFTEHQPIHHLYNPAQRLKYFPRADWSFLAAAARNCAAAFEEVHAVGCLVGDINQSNVLVSSRATIGLIDCDSFQVQANGRLFLCEVGVPHYTPPELQHRNFTGLARTLNHDRFGLAVLLFQLLFMGRHPYAGRYLGAGDLPFEQFIQEFRFAYGPQASALRMEQPPHTLALDGVSPAVAQLFRCAFERGSEAIDARPTATQWLQALDEFRSGLKPCPNDAGHRLGAHETACPWCAFVAHGGPNYFRGVAVVAVVFKFDSARLRGLTERIRNSAVSVAYSRSRIMAGTRVIPRALPAELANSSRLGVVLGTVTSIALVLLFLSPFLGKTLALFGAPIFVVFGVWFVAHWVASPRHREYRSRVKAEKSAEHTLGSEESRWQRFLADHRTQETRIRKELDSALEQCRLLEKRFRGDEQSLEKNRQAMQLEHHLRNCFISDADIPGIGPTREQALISFGVETAFDIEPAAIDKIKGFGEVLTGNLIAWKKKMAKEFHFDPHSRVPETALRTLTLKYQHMQDTLFAQLERGATELETMTQSVQRECDTREPDLRRLAADWAQAKADVQVLAWRRGGR
jgi:DNA-binding helix-hairpin-helix protein with protein kinase domain